MARNFVSVLKRNSFEVQKLEIGSASDFARILADLQDRLRGRIASLPADRIVDVSVLRQLLGETQSVIAELEHKGDTLFGNAQKDAAELASGHIVEEIKRLSRAFEEQAITVDVNAYEVLHDPPQQLLADHFETSVNRYGQDLLNGIRRELILGLRTGATTGDMAKRIAGMQGPLGTVGRNNADRLVRTEVSQAYGAAHHKGLQEAKKQVPGLKDVWLHIGSFICPTCIPLHGTERPEDGYWTIKSGKRLRRVLHNPAHPNCVCRVSSMRPSWRKGLEAAGYLDRPKDAAA